MHLPDLFRLRPEPASDAERLLGGVRSIADLVAPAAVEVARDHLRLDQQYARALVVTGYPRTVEPGWLQPLLELDQPVELSLHLYPLDRAESARALGAKLVQLESSRLFDARAGRLADPEREVAYADIERLREALERGEEKIFSASLYLLLRAPSLPALDAVTRRVEGLLDGMLAQCRVALLEQEAAFHACLPEGRDRLLVYRNLDTSSLATMFPFASAGLAMPRGAFYGIDRRSRSPVWFDPFDPQLDNANLVVFATSGAGKSYFTKLMALRHLLLGVDCVAIDPEGEYRPLCQAVRGQQLRLAASSGLRLNPFDLPPAGHEAVGLDQLAEQVAALLGLLDLMLAEPGQGLSTDQRAVLDQALSRTYAAAGITDDPNTHARPAPLLCDLYATLQAGPGEQAAVLATRLRRYVEGSLRGLFAGPTNVALDRRMVVFDLQALEPELRPLGVHLIATCLWNRVRRVRRPRLLLIDEAWGLLQEPAGGAFLAGLARRARKYHLGLVVISQEVADCLGSEHGRTVLANAASALLLKQSSATIDPVVDAFGLSPGERRFLLGADKGQGLFLVAGARLPLAVTASPAEHRLATTAPHELLEPAQTEGEQTA